MGAARSGSSSPLHDVVGVGPAGSGTCRGAGALGARRLAVVRRDAVSRPGVRSRSLSGTDNSLDGIGNDRAKLTGADVSAVPTTPCARLRVVLQPGARSPPNDLGTFGNVAKGAYYGPSLQLWDMGLSKNFHFNGTPVRAGRAWSSSTSSTMVNLDHPELRREQPGDARPHHTARIPAQVIRAFCSSG